MNNQHVYADYCIFLGIFIHFLAFSYDSLIFLQKISNFSFIFSAFYSYKLIFFMQYIYLSSNYFIA